MLVGVRRSRSQEMGLSHTETNTHTHPKASPQQKRRGGGGQSGVKACMFAHRGAQTAKTLIPFTAELTVTS